jgi:hypothetical protein
VVVVVVVEDVVVVVVDKTISVEFKQLPKETTLIVVAKSGTKLDVYPAISALEIFVSKGTVYASELE